MVEPETIETVRIRKANNLGVCNLTTLSGIYFANDILVHNCGVPVIVSDYASAPEICGAGLTVRADDYIVINTPGTRYCLASIEGIADALTKIMNLDRGKLARKAREFALRYDWKKVMEQYWKPFLFEAEAELRPLITKEGARTW